jgi:hypothetical protein
LDPKRTLDCHRLSRHASRYKGDLRTLSIAVLDKPISASSRSSSSRSCLRWDLRSQARAIPASPESRIFHHLRSGNEGEVASKLLVELVMLPQDMFHLRKGAKQRLAAGAHRAVVNGPSKFCITSTFCPQGIARFFASNRTSPQNELAKRFSTLKPIIPRKGTHRQDRSPSLRQQGRAVTLARCELRNS